MSLPTSSLERILSLSEKLIGIKSLSGFEVEVFQLMEMELIARGFKVERLPVPGNESWNLLATIDSPEIILTTHLDIVPAPESLFVPERRDGKLWGRGACDAKGIAAVMVEAASTLVQQGKRNLGLLFVVGEETISMGAKAAAPILQKKGVKFIVNGEPTECYLVKGHKGALTVELQFAGKSAHSGYPELGEDANNKLIRTCAVLMETDFGTNDFFGKASINLGVIDGGVAGNVVSPKARVKCLVRTVTSNDEVFEKLLSLCPEASEINRLGNSEPIRLHTVAGFPTMSVSYGTDVPHLVASGAKCLLYGPGSINVAHTDFEHVEFSQLLVAYEGYQKIVASLFD